MIKIVLMDIDGVLTNGKITIDSSGNEWKTIDFKDIDAIFTLKEQGINVGLITGEDTPITLSFKERFKPDFFYNKCKDKCIAMDDILAKTGFTVDEVCFIGDGKYDVQIMKKVKFAACPANAIPEVKKLSNILLDHNGGDGCIWELMEYIMIQNNNENK